MPRQTPSNRSLAALAVLSLTGTLLMVLGAVASSPASALTPPIVPIPTCYKLANDNESCPQINGDGTFQDDPSDDLGATITGSITSGTSFSITLHPPVGPCTNYAHQGNCYVGISHIVGGGRYFITLNSDLSTHRVGERLTGAISSQPGVMQITPRGGCDEEFNDVYGDGYHFADRAGAALTCTFDVAYTKSYEDDTPVPIDLLKGPSWYEIGGSILVCDTPGGGFNCNRHAENITSLVRLNGDLAPAPTAECTVGYQDGPGGSSIRFDGDASPNTILDTVKSWSVQPSTAMWTYHHASNKYESTAEVTATQPGQVNATYQVRTWQGISEDTCSATVLDDPDLPTPTEEPTEQPTTNPSPTPTPTPSCTGPGKPSLSRATAKVGKAVKVKPGPWGKDATLAYKWKAGTKVVGKKAKLNPTRAMVGKKLKVTITAARRGCARKEQVVLAVGKVRG